ncbi:MAG: M48 family metallopeptidase [candidate division Zixibacteria bacterium]|nr:M48 family metallopeptidase [candidate division Zixibacteria bacterium]
MVESVVINIEGVGSVLFELNKQAKCIQIIDTPSKGICVEVPPGVSFNEAIEFARSEIGRAHKPVPPDNQDKCDNKNIIDKSDNDSTVVDIPGIGEVLFERKEKIRRIKIYATSSGSIQVAVPHKASFKEAEEYVLSSISLIKKQLLKMKYIEPDYKPEPTANSKIKNIPEIGPVQFIRSEKAARMVISVKPFEGVCITVPKGTSFRNAKKLIISKIDWIKKCQAKVKLIEHRKTNMSRKIAKIDIPAAKERLFNRLKKLAKKHGFNYNNAAIRNQKTRWGSCSSKNNINLNISLVLLPPKLVDYVILHELVHTRIKNHSKEFWSELDKYVGGSLALRAEMKNYSPGKI